MVIYLILLNLLNTNRKPSLTASEHCSATVSVLACETEVGVSLTPSVLVDDAYQYESPIGRTQRILSGIYSCVLFRTIMHCGLDALFVSIPTRVRTRMRQNERRGKPRILSFSDRASSSL